MIAMVVLIYLMKIGTGKSFLDGSECDISFPSYSNNLLIVF